MIQVSEHEQNEKQRTFYFNFFFSSKKRNGMQTIKPRIKKQKCLILPTKKKATKYLNIWNLMKQEKFMRWTFQKSLLLYENENNPFSLAFGFV